MYAITENYLGRISFQEAKMNNINTFFKTLKVE
jgi:hypothetical protein